MDQLYRVTFLQWTSWHAVHSSSDFSRRLPIPIKQRLIYLQMPRGMSRVHLNVKYLDRWQSVCTECTDSKSMNTWWEWRNLTYKAHYTLGSMHFGGVLVALKACLGWNVTSIMSRSLSKLASYNSTNIILDWMVDFRCARTSIRGQEEPSRASCSIAMNTWAVSQYPTLCDANLECARTSMIWQQKLQLCYK